MPEHDPNQPETARGGSAYANGSSPLRDLASQPDRPQQGAGITETARQDWQEVKDVAKTELSHATEKAKEAAANQKNFAAERVSGLASAIEKVGAELEQEQPEVSRYVKQIGGGMKRFADDIKGKDLREVAAVAERFGRSNPAAFLGAAALAGFAASRFLTASSSHVSSSSPTRSEDRSSEETRAPATNASSNTSSPVAPATGMGYRTGYSAGGNYNG